MNFYGDLQEKNLHIRFDHIDLPSCKIVTFPRVLREKVLDFDHIILPLSLIETSRGKL